LGTDLQPTFFHEIGRETLKLEREFNEAAGFTAADDDLPAFFYDEPLAPSNQAARFKGAEVHDIFDHMDEVGTMGIPEEYGRVTSS
jgi:aldehyde:ferredoxin oxidoreductase